MKPNIFLETKTLEDALRIWEEKLLAEGAYRPFEAETLKAVDSLRRVTAEPVIAKISSPFYHASAMDGYAVRFESTFGASETSPKRLVLGREAIYVNTGDPVPEGFNAIIMVEDINLTEDAIEFIAPVTPWQNVRTVGEDIVATELIAPENHVIRPIDMGAMLAGGITDVNVRRKPRVAFIPTGNEVVEPGTELKKGNIIEFNSRVLSGLVEEWGGEAIRHDIVSDDPEKLKVAVLKAHEIADIIAVIAGASTGTRDYTYSVIKELGEPILHGLRIKPGKPAMLGWIKGKPLIGVPGYPVSAFITFSLFVRPLLMRWLGQDTAETEFLRAKLSRQVASSLGQEEFLRMKVGKVGENFIATPLGRGAGLVMSLVRADGFLRIPTMSEGLGAGAEVDIELLRKKTEIENTIVSIGSHDNTLDILANTLKKHHPKYSLSSAHVGSMGGLMAIKKGEAHIAPTHLLDEDTGEYNVPFIRKLLPERDIVLINLVYRQQGFMVLRGNPKQITGFHDLVRDDIIYINRQRGAGTRLLLDKHLNDLKINPSDINGYEREEYTHMAVASAVLTGVSDTGLGILSAAHALGLDFVPVAEERYDLAIPQEYIDDAKVAALLEIVRDDKSFRETVLSLGGYDIRDMGMVMWRSDETEWGTK